MTDQTLKVQTIPDAEEGMATPTKQKPGQASAVSPTATEPLSPQSPQHFTFEHNVTSGGRSRGIGLFAVKPLLMLILPLGVIAALGYFVSQFLQLPGLQTQVGRLEGEVDRLQSEVYRLNGEVTRLEDQNDRYQELNEELNGTVQELNGINENLNASVVELSEINADLNVVVLDLSETNSQLNFALKEYEKLNMELSTVVKFLNQTSLGLDKTLDEVTEFLSSQIEANQVLIEGSLENFFKSQFAHWDCQFWLVFREKSWGSDPNAAIPEEDWEEVLDYVATNVLDELCIDRGYFEQYLQERGTELTTFGLETAVTIVTQEMLDFYFPENGEAGLTHDDWADAGYKCENLPKITFL